jgi:thiamine biosynthesis protein ThiS
MTPLVTVVYARPELKIRLNGEPHELAAPLTVTALLAELGIDPRRVAVEHNQIVVKRAAYDQTLVNENDEVEIVNFVGGGSIDPLKAVS